MSETETMLINLIREHKNPEKALTAAIEIILSFLTRPEASALKSSVVSQESF